MTNSDWFFLGEYLGRRLDRVERLLRRVLDTQEDMLLDQTRMNAALADLAREVSETAELIRGLKDAPQAEFDAAADRVQAAADALNALQDPPAPPAG